MTVRASQEGLFSREIIPVSNVHTVEAMLIHTYLYILYIELLILKLKNDLIGMKIGYSTAKLGAYVDDITVFVTYNKDINSLNSNIINFEKCTNSRIGRSKTNIMGFGNLENNNSWLINWIQTKPFLNILGFNFTLAGI